MESAIGYMKFGEEERNRNSAKTIHDTSYAWYRFTGLNKSMEDCNKKGTRESSEKDIQHWHIL